MGITYGLEIKCIPGLKEVANATLLHKKNKRARSVPDCTAAERLSARHTEHLIEHTALKVGGELDVCNHLVQVRIYFNDAA